MADRYNVRIFDRVTSLRFPSRHEISEYRLDRFQHLESLQMGIPYVPAGENLEENTGLQRYLHRNRERFQEHAEQFLAQVYPDRDYRIEVLDNGGWLATLK